MYQYEIDYTRTRRNESYHSLQPSKVNCQLEKVKRALEANVGGLTSREIANTTGMERTAITRTLSDYKALFDTTTDKICQFSGKKVTLYKLKG